jgi:hypothetical protein
MRKMFCCVVLTAVFLVTSNVHGADFRLHTKVYQEEVETPVSQNTTLFRGGLVYDFISDPLEITIYDRPHGDKPGRFILLDAARQVQTEVQLADVQQFMERVSGWAAARDDALVNFLARPQFKEERLPEDDGWQYTSTWMTYRIKTLPAGDDAIFRQYDDFSDWFVRLNTMLTIRSRPPYGLARLAVNASLRPRKEIPEEVTLTVTTNRLLRKQITYRTAHQLTTLVSSSDLAKIADVEDYRVRFKKVTLEEYVQPATASK